MKFATGWKKKLLFIALLSSAGGASASVSTDAYTDQRVTQIVETIVIPGKNVREGDRIAQISRAFLGTPYRENTLGGGVARPETLTATFTGVDCFTLLDYVYALSKSGSEGDFFANLSAVRYENGQVSYLKRRHFFTDWAAKTPLNAADITARLSPYAVTVDKTLNLKAGGGEYISGLGGIARQITYIPVGRVTPQVLEQLRSGDLVGIYARAAGLDVSHVGIVIKEGGEVYFRNASPLAQTRRVVDAPLGAYLRNKPGIVVLRPL